MAGMPIYLADKPLHATSHDVVAAARRQFRTRRVGHAGTLDPLAAGVLVLLVGDATKLSPFLTASDKRYLAWVSFGAATPTLDAEGPVVEEADAGRLDADAVRAALPPFLALAEQVPPAYSAVKRGGVKGYEAARRGEELALPARPAGYRSVRLLGFAATRDELPRRFAPGEDGAWRPDPEGRPLPLPPSLGHHPTALLDVAVRAGTYVRAFARDLGAALGLPAHLSGLVRTRAGRAGLEHARPLEELGVEHALPARSVLALPGLELDPEAAARVRQGQRPSLPEDGRFALYAAGNELVAVAERREGRSRLLRVWGVGAGE